MMKKFSTLLLLFFALFFAGCRDNSSGTKPPQLSTVYVINEGNFSDANGSVTSFNPATKTITQKAFQAKNGRPFAGFIQNSEVINDRLYLVSNTANKIEVMDLNTLSSLGTISYSKTPVDIAPASDGKAYVTNLYDNSVSVVNLEKLQQTDITIPVGKGPRNMVAAGDNVFVANNGGLQINNVDSTISVINISNDKVVNKIAVGDKPKTMVVDSSDRIWLICSGFTAYDENYNRLRDKDTPGSLYVIDANNEQVIYAKTLDQRPKQIVLNEHEGRAYLLTDKVEAIDMNTYKMEDADFINRSFDTIGFSAGEELIYAGKSNGLTQQGEAVRYNLQGAAIDSFSTGISPIAFHFLAQ